MQHINTLIKPTHKCNMRCKYCFGEKYGYDAKVLEVEKLKKYLLLLSKKYDHINLVWHGGEPLLVPLEYYIEIYDFCKNLDSSFSYSLQTNGTLVTAEILDFFINNDTSIGLSFDGLSNDLTRGNTTEIIKSIKLMHSFGIYPGAILVVNQYNVKNLIDEYEFFKKLELGMKLNPLFIDGAAKNNPFLELDPHVYIEQFVNFFKYWAFDVNCNISVSNCNEMINLILNKKSSICTNNSCLGKWLCLDSNGDIYPCDRLCIPEYRLSNVEDIKSIDSIFESEQFIKLLQESVFRRRSCMSECEIYESCYGGCNANAILYRNTPMNISCYTHKKILISLREYLCSLSKNSDCDNLNSYLTKSLSLRRESLL